MAKEKSNKTKFRIYKIKNDYLINGMLEDIKGVLSDNDIIYDEINKTGFSSLIYNSKSDLIG